MRFIVVHTNAAWMPYIIELDFEGDKLVGKQEHCHVEKEFKGKQRADKK